MTKHTRYATNTRNDTRNISRNTKSRTTHSNTRDCSTHGRIPKIPRAPYLTLNTGGIARKFFTTCTANCLAPFLFIVSTSQHELTQHSSDLSQRFSRSLSGIVRNSSISRTNYHNYHATPATLSHMAGLFSFPQFRLLHPHDYSLHAVSLLHAKSFRTPCGACAQSR